MGVGGEIGASRGLADFDHSPDLRAVCGPDVSLRMQSARDGLRGKVRPVYCSLQRTFAEERLFGLMSFECFLYTPDRQRGIQMRSRLVPLLMVLLSFLLSCTGQSGSSDEPAYAVAGRWDGAIAPDGVGNAKEFKVIFELEGPAEEGSVIGKHLFCQVLDGPACMRFPFSPSTCPGRAAYQWAGELVGSNMAAVSRNTVGEAIELDVEFTSEDTAEGRYEYIDAGPSGPCLGETGTVTLTRFVAAE